MRVLSAPGLYLSHALQRISSGIMRARRRPYSRQAAAVALQRRRAGKRNAVEVRLLVKALLRDGSIVKLDNDREGGPFFGLSGYVEPVDRLDNSDLVLGRDYSGQYEAPIRRNDATAL
jgi:hypothetical protein